MSWRIVAIAVLVMFFGSIAYMQEAGRVKFWRGVTTERSVIEVVDMGPVCLYVVNRAGWQDSPAVWGIPKAQLPAGQGCQ